MIWLVPVVAVLGALQQDPIAAAETLLKQGQYAPAARSFEAVTVQNPKAAQAWFGLAVCYSQMQQPGDVVAAIRKYLELEPHAADGHAVLGLALQAQVRLSEARAELERAIRLDPEQTEAIEALANVCLLEGDAARAVSLLQALPRPAAADPEVRLTLGSALARTGDYAAAVATLQPLVDADPPGPPQAFITAAAALRKLGRRDDALRLCERGMCAYPNSVRIEAVYLAEPMQTLVVRIRERLKAVPSHAAGLPEMIQLGRNIVDSDSARTAPLDAAESLLSQAVRFAPGNPSAWYYYSRCLFALRRLEDALAAVQQGLGLSPDAEMSTLLETELGIIETNLSHPDRAEKAFLVAMDSNRKLAVPLSEAAFQYFQFLALQSRPADAQAVIEEILRREPFFLAARLENAKYLESEDQLDRAIREGEMVIRNTEDPKMLRAAHIFLAKTCHRAGRLHDAERHQAWIKSNS
jgi:tetratricopeptide (TPR) repeat protein